MAAQDQRGAETHYRKALKVAPRDYAALVKMAECLTVQKRYPEARRYAEDARQVYPGEARAHHVSGIARMMTKDWSGAYEAFAAYEERLPGNPNTVFLKGLSLEGMGRNPRAAQEYYRYLQSVSSGEPARYAYGRLVEWGYIEKSKQ